MRIGNREFDTANRCYIMGILNVTPDSFSDGGRFLRFDDALSHAEKMIAEGADIIDVGGESTRPGYTQVSEEEEIERTAPIVEALKENFDVPVSIDTCKGVVAEAALESGADMVNDVWGFRRDDMIAETTVRHGAACCLMHNRKETVYDNFLQDVVQDLEISVRLAKRAGIPDERIIVDPGIGFAKSLEQNLIMMKNVDMLHTLGYPVMLGTSRKSMIGLSLDLPAGERLEGTLATTVIGVMKGCSFVRVHDVAENRRAVAMTEAIMRSGE